MPLFDLEKMTAPEVRKAIDEGFDTVICPFGSLEQHSAHLPIGTDAMLGDSFGRRLAEKLDAFLAPTVRVGYADHHMPFAGTMTLSLETVQRIGEEYARCLARHGFKQIILLGTHGGNFKPLADAARNCADIEGVKVIAPMRDFDTDVLDPVHAVSARYGISRGDSGGHAGEWETSIMLVLTPELVHMDKATVGFTGDMSDAVKQLLEDKRGIDIVTNGTGILGDATQADAARGELHFNALLAAMERGIEREWPEGFSSRQAGSL